MAGSNINQGDIPNAVKLMGLLADALDDESGFWLSNKVMVADADTLALVPSHIANPACWIGSTMRCLGFRSVRKQNGINYFIDKVSLSRGRKLLSDRLDSLDKASQALEDEDYDATVRG